MPSKKPKCDCHLFEVCDVCQGATGNEKDKQDKAPYGYHTVKISKGVLGESSKIREELEELQDAERQGVRILVACELADLYGALRHCAAGYGLTMGDLGKMSDLTENAFRQGHR